MNPLPPQVMREWVPLLPQVLHTFRDISDILARDEPSSELKKFYLHLSARIFLLSNISDESPSVFSTQLSESPVLPRLLQLLDRVGASLVPESNRLSAENNLPGLYATLILWSDVPDSRERERILTAQKNLDFGSRERQNELIDNLKEAEDVCRTSFKIGKPDINAEQDICRKMRQMPPLDIWPLAQSVYSALDSTNTDPCDMCNTPHGYGARLCIETYRAQHDEPGCDFDMFLGLDKLWHEARIRPINNSMVKFLVDDECNTSKSTAKTRSIKKARVKSLCRQIKESQSRWMFRLNFEVRNNELWKIPSERSRREADSSQEVVSLSQFIAKQPGLLNGKTKRILAVLLAYAVLHLHGTEWLQPTLSSHDIMFFKTNGAVPLKPYLQVRIKPKTSDHCPKECIKLSEDEDDEMDPDDELFYHPYPCLVSLALILLELHQARPIQDIAEENNLTISEDMTNENRFLMAGQIFESSKQDFEDQTRMAIDACLDPGIGGDLDDDLPDEDRLRAAIYENIVRRLEDELEQGHSYISIEGLDTLAQTLDFARFGRPIKAEKPANPMLVPMGGKNRSAASKRMRNDDGENTQRSLDYLGPGSGLGNPDAPKISFFDGQRTSHGITTSSSEAYDRWKRGVLGVYQKFAPEVFDNSPVKIVVLDTGIDKDHLDFDACEERIKASVSYLGQNTKDVRDTSGHGTHVASLLCEYAPDADIYIIRIAERNPVSSAIIARAINDAVAKWQPDIITMSFGWPARDSEYETLEKAIKNAQFHDVLLFAAASNDGANAKRAYPARHSGVICIHSTAADGNPSTFNPVATRGDNFAIVGEAVEGAWPRHLCDTQVNESCVMRKSGTSFATPIAAGIAAFLLQYARSKLDRRESARLKQFEGMTAVFRRISVDKNGYHYVAPRLHPDNFFGKGEEYINANLREALS